MEAGGDQLAGAGVGKHIARDLFNGEFLERHVLVQGVDYPVAVFPGIQPQIIFFVTMAVRIAGEVEPGTRPSFAVVGIGQQAIHEFLVGIRTLVRQEGVHFLGRWRKTNEVEVDAADQGFFAGLGRRRKALLFELGQYKIVNGIAAPRRILHSRNFRPHRFYVGPVLDHTFSRRANCGERFGGVRPQRALIDPLPDQVHLLLGKRRTSIRHLGLFESKQPPRHGALLTAAGDDDFS